MDSKSEPECIDCADQKAKAEERQDRLQLGGCKLLYQARAKERGSP